MVYGVRCTCVPRWGRARCARRTAAAVPPDPRVARRIRKAMRRRTRPCHAGGGSGQGPWPMATGLFLAKRSPSSVPRSAEARAGGRGHGSPSTQAWTAGHGRSPTGSRSIRSPRSRGRTPPASCRVAGVTGARVNACYQACRGTQQPTCHGQASARDRPLWCAPGAGAKKSTRRPNHAARLASEMHPPLCRPP